MDVMPGERAACPNFRPPSFNVALDAFIIVRCVDETKSEPAVRNVGRAVGAVALDDLDHIGDAAALDVFLEGGPDATAMRFDCRQMIGPITFAAKSIDGDEVHLFTEPAAFLRQINN